MPLPADYDPTNPAHLGYVLTRSGTVVQIPTTLCCGITWTCDGVLLGPQPDGRNVGWTRSGQCGICHRPLPRR